MFGNFIGIRFELDWNWFCVNLTVTIYQFNFQMRKLDFTHLLIWVIKVFFSFESSSFHPKKAKFYYCQVVSIDKCQVCVFVKRLVKYAVTEDIPLDSSLDSSDVLPQFTWHSIDTNSLIQSSGFHPKESSMHYCQVVHIQNLNWRRHYDVTLDFSFDSSDMIHKFTWG